MSWEGTEKFDIFKIKESILVDSRWCISMIYIFIYIFMYICIQYVSFSVQFYEECPLHYIPLLNFAMSS